MATRRIILIGFAAVVQLALVESVARAQCASDADCRAGRRCQEGRCVAAGCTRDVDCPPGQVCEQGGCVVQGGPVAPAAPAPLVPAVPPAGYAMPGAQPYAPFSPVLGYRTEQRPLTAVAIGGAIMLGASWLLTIAVTAVLSDPAVAGRFIGYAAVPVVGPWIILTDPDFETGYAVGVVVSGLIQAAGLTMLIVGLAARRTVQVPVTTFGTGPRVPRLAFSAQIGGGGAGLGLVLTHF